MKTEFRLTALFMLATLTLAPSALSGQSEPEVLATVNGESISRDAVYEEAAGALAGIEAADPRPDTYAGDRLRILWEALDALVDRRLLELEAATFDWTTEQLLEVEVESNVMAPSDAEVVAFYGQNRDQIALGLEEAMPLVREYMIDRNRQQWRDRLIARLKTTYDVETYLDPLRIPVETEGHPSRGPADAPVTIVEFGDFECPYCGAMFPTLELVLDRYPEDVRLVYRQFPLGNIHPRAQKAAEAALCARDQGRFWEFHDSMFGNQSALEPADLKQRARALDLDSPARFDQCLDSSAKAAAVQTDVDLGRAAGVTGTPTLFVNGRLLSGSQTPRAIQLVIEDELGRLEN
jgi:protein-disulfide isomerase